MIINIFCYTETGRKSGKKQKKDKVKCTLKEKCESKGRVCKKDNETCNGKPIDLKCKDKQCACCKEGKYSDEK